MRPSPRLIHIHGQWRVLVERAPQMGRDAHTLDLGGCTSRKVAVRLWLALRPSEARP